MESTSEEDLTPSGEGEVRDEDILRSLVLNPYKGIFISYDIIWCKLTLVCIIIEKREIGIRERGMRLVAHYEVLMFDRKEWEVRQ